MSLKNDQRLGDSAGQHDKAREPARGMHLSGEGRFGGLVCGGAARHPDGVVAHRSVGNRLLVEPSVGRLLRAIGTCGSQWRNRVQSAWTARYPVTRVLLRKSGDMPRSFGHSDHCLSAASGRQVQRKAALDRRARHNGSRARRADARSKERRDQGACRQTPKSIRDLHCSCSVFVFDRGRFGDPAKPRPS